MFTWRANFGECINTNLTNGFLPLWALKLFLACHCCILWCKTRSHLFKKVKELRVLPTHVCNNNCFSESEEPCGIQLFSPGHSLRRGERLWACVSQLMSNIFTFIDTSSDFNLRFTWETLTLPGQLLTPDCQRRTKGRSYITHKLLLICEVKKKRKKERNERAGASVLSGENNKVTWTTSARSD